MVGVKTLIGECRNQSKCRSDKLACDVPSSHEEEKVEDKENPDVTSDMDVEKISINDDKKSTVDETGETDEKEDTSALECEVGDVSSKNDSELDTST